MEISSFASTQEVLKELGIRLKALRIAADITQEQMSERTGLSRRTISSLENGGDVSLSSLLEVMRVLDRLQALDVAIPKQTIRPSDMAVLGKKRERARKKSANKDEQENWKWGDET